VRKSVHAVTAGVIALSFALASSGVHAANHTNASTTPPKLQKDVTLSIWDYFANTDPEYAAFQKVLANFTMATGVKVSTPQNPSSSNNKFQLAAPTGNAPDLIGIPHDQIAGLAAAKVLAPVPAWAWPASAQKGYIKGAVQASNVDGHTYAMPWAIETTGLFYNKALVNAKTVFKPAKGEKYLSWKTLAPRLQKLTDLPNKKFGFVMDMGNFYYDYAFLSGFGGYVFKYKAGKGFQANQLGLGSSSAVKAINLYASLAQGQKYNLVPPTFTTGDADAAFEAGQAAVEWSGPWNKGNYTAKNINFGFQPLPSVDGKHRMRPFSTVQVYAVNKFSKHPNEAFALLKYISANMELPLFKAAGRIPVIKADLNSKTVQKDPLSKSLAAAALAAAPIPGIPEMNAVWTPAGTDWQQVAEGKASAAAAAAQSQKDVAAAIAKLNGG
jgi:arabinogalactan oligomer/maltooligosaccharide transport system substrate-binding protein